MKPKEEISRSTSALSSLVVEVSESRPFSSNFVRRALVVVCPSASLAGILSSSSFNHSSWLQCDRGSKILFDAEPVGSTRFSRLRFLRRRFRFRPDACDEIKNQIEKRARMKYHTAICFTLDNWRRILYMCERAVRG